MASERKRVGARSARRCCAAAAGAAAVALATSAIAHGGAVVPVRSGDITIVDAGTRRRPLERGASATEFAIEPPAGASCPGDSEHDSWRVQTFLAPASVDPGTLPYGADWPRRTEHLYSLYDTITQPVIDVLTVPNPAAGAPGRIDALAPMSFAVFPAGELPAGRYVIGVACTLLYSTADFWDTEIVIDASADDRPGKMIWRVADASLVPSQSGDTNARVRWMVLTGAVLTVGLASVLGFRRQRVHPVSSPRSKELL